MSLRMCMPRSRRQSLTGFFDGVLHVFGARGIEAYGMDLSLFDFVGFSRWIGVSEEFRLLPISVLEEPPPLGTLERPRDRGNALFHSSISSSFPFSLAFTSLR